MDTFRSGLKKGSGTTVAGTVPQLSGSPITDPLLGRWMSSDRAEIAGPAGVSLAFTENGYRLSASNANTAPIFNGDARSGASGSFTVNGRDDLSTCPVDAVGSYRWRVTEPGERLMVHIDSLHEGTKAFEATLTLRRPQQANRLEPDDLLAISEHVARVNATPAVLVLRVQQGIICPAGAETGLRQIAKNQRQCIMRAGIGRTACQHVGRGSKRLGGLVPFRRSGQGKASRVVIHPTVALGARGSVCHQKLMHCVSLTRRRNPRHRGLRDCASGVTFVHGATWKIGRASCRERVSSPV